MLVPAKLRLTRRVLHRVAKPITFEKPKQLAQLAERMHQCMLDLGGIGLAAPQVGIGRRMFVMAVVGVKLTCFNPRIIGLDAEQQEDCKEGCLSFPDEYVYTRRCSSIRVEYQDAEGLVHEQHLTGIAAICFQHELDHLDGVTMHQREV